MLGWVIFLNYLYPRSFAVDVNIDGIIVPHTMIDYGASINVINKETMLKLNLQLSLRKTTIVFQLVNRSTIALKGVVEDVLVSIDCWEYPANFLVLQPNTKFNGYPIILGVPWLATIDAYILCRVRNMTIESGHLSKRMVLYPPPQTSMEHDLPLWLKEVEEDVVYSSLISTLDTTIGGAQHDEDDLIEKIL